MFLPACLRAAQPACLLDEAVTRTDLSRNGSHTLTSKTRCLLRLGATSRIQSGCARFHPFHAKPRAREDVLLCARKRCLFCCPRAARSPGSLLFPYPREPAEARREAVLPSSAVRRSCCLRAMGPLFPALRPYRPMRGRRSRRNPRPAMACLLRHVLRWPSSVRRPRGSSAANSRTNPFPQRLPLPSPGKLHSACPRRRSWELRRERSGTMRRWTGLPCTPGLISSAQPASMWSAELAASAASRACSLPVSRAVPIASTWRRPVKPARYAWPWTGRRNGRSSGAGSPAATAAKNMLSMFRNYPQ